MLTLSYLQTAQRRRRQASEGGPGQRRTERIKLDREKIMGRRGTSMDKVEEGLLLRHTEGY